MNQNMVRWSEDLLSFIRLVILFDMLLNPSFKMTRSLANIARTTATISKFIH